MAVHLRVRIEGIDEMTQTLDKLNPSRNSAWVARALVDCALLTQDIAARQMIKAGGRVRGPRGPRGGKGKLISSAPLAHKLTSRTSFLRDSIAVNRSGLPFSIDVGTDVIYGAVHELGLTVNQHVRSHTRTVAFGRKVSPFTVNAFSRTAHYPARPFLGPALDKASGRFSELFGAELAKELR